MKQKQLNNQIHYINILYICKQQIPFTGNRNNIEIFLYSWLASCKHALKEQHAKLTNQSVKSLKRNTSAFVSEMGRSIWNLGLRPRS